MSRLGSLLNDGSFTHAPDARERARLALLANGMSRSAAKAQLGDDKKACVWVEMFSYTVAR